MAQGFAENVRLSELLLHLLEATVYCMSLSDPTRVHMQLAEATLSRQFISAYIQ